MKGFILSILLSFFSLGVIAAPLTPTDSLRIAVDSFLTIAGNKSLSNPEKKALIIDVVKEKMNMKVLAQRVASRHWKKASKEEQSLFIENFTQVVVNTYFALLSEYTNEKVEYLKEEIKKKKYAKVETHIVMSDKKIPVLYKLILRKDQWRIYDFSAEGVSMTSTYINDYKSTLKRGGLKGLNEILAKKLAKNKAS